jgi:hypothetical protein
MQGTFLADEYIIKIEGKTYSGKCEDVTVTTQFEWADGSMEKSGWAFMLGMLCNSAEKYDEQGNSFISQNRGKDYKTGDKYRVDGDRIIMLNRTGGDRSESEVGVKTLKDNFLVLVTKDGSEMTIIYKKMD